MCQACAQSGRPHPSAPPAPSLDDHILRDVAVEESALVVHRHLCGNNAGVAGQPVNVSASWPRLVEAGRGWRLAAAGGRPELDLARAGRAGGRIGRRLWAAGFRIAGHGEGESRRLGGGRAARCAAGDEAILLAVVGEREAHVERDLLRYGTLVTPP